MEELQRAAQAGEKSLPQIIEGLGRGLTVQELIALVPMSESKAYYLCKSGKIKNYKIGDLIILDPFQTANWLRSLSSDPADQKQLATA